MKTPRYFVVGHLNKAHGTKGELFVWPLTDHPDIVFAAGARVRLGDENGEPAELPARHLVIEDARPFRKGVLVRFEGVESRTAAEFLKGAYLLLDADEVEAPAEGEYFYHELLGAPVATAAGEAVGTVREVYELAPAHLLEVDRPDGRTLLVPLSRPIVERVERDPLRIVIDPPAGFLEL